MSETTEDTPWLARQVEETKKRVAERPKWMREVGQMSEGIVVTIRKGKITSPVMTRADFEDGDVVTAYVDGVAFTLPELAARDQRIRSEALEEVADHFLKNHTHRMLNGVAIEKEIRALAEKG